ncbi:hypothetical protein HAX54_039687, partial [Datura stramonium]|nr:hypothetical protein [Datura stramonium]
RSIYHSEYPLGRALVYEKEQGDGLEKIECLVLLDATDAHVSREGPLETLDKPLTWERPKPSIEKAP